MRREFEREFFSLAVVWLECRLKLIRANTGKERMWCFLGEIDYHTEMAVMIEEERKRRGLLPPSSRNFSGRVPRLFEVSTRNGIVGNEENF